MKIDIKTITKTTHFTLGKPVWLKISFWRWTKIWITLNLTREELLI